MASACRIVFMGTPAFALASLDMLYKSGHEVIAVVTAPDKPSGRGRKLKASPVKEYAVEAGIPVLQPLRLKDPGFVDTLRTLNADIFIVVAFRMLPEQVWSLPRIGTVNLHASLLPDYRGAAPINHVIINGETRTGLSTFMIDEEIDTGNLLERIEMKIGDLETAGELHDRMMDAGAGLLLSTVNGLLAHSLTGIPQQDIPIPASGWHTAPKIFPEDCRISWERDAQSICNLVRGLDPFPGAFTNICSEDGTRLKLKLFNCTPGTHGQTNIGSPGSINSDGKTFITIECAKGSISVAEIQLEGRRRMSTREFLRGFNILEFPNAC